MSWEAEQAMDYMGGWAEGGVGYGVQTTRSRQSVPQAVPGLVSASEHQSSVTRKQTGWALASTLFCLRVLGHRPSGDLGTSPPAIGHSALKSSPSSAPNKWDRRVPGSRTHVRKRPLPSSCCGELVTPALAERVSTDRACLARD